MEEFKRALEQGFIEHFEKYGENQIHLWLLATLPEFRRHGAGTMLCNWGKEKASERNCAITVFGSPMGTALYKKLGYRLLDSVSIHVDGEDEKLNVFCLVLDQS
jgi:GNAT superfamily N-acetyltransferase